MLKNRREFHYLLLFISLASVLLATLALRHIPVAILPEVKPLTIEVQTEALGLSASEVEHLVTLNLEEMLSNTPWLKEMHSRSVLGLSSIVLTFQDGTDLMEARQMVSENLTRAHAIPNVSQAPIILQPTSSENRLLMVGLTSDELSLIDISELARWNIQPALLSVRGVANVAIWGARERQLQVRVDQNSMAARGVALNDVVSTTGDAFWSSPLSYLLASTPGTGGWIDTPNQRMAVRHELPIEKDTDLAKVSVFGKEYLALQDIAEVREDHQPLIGDAIINGTPGVMLMIEKFPGEDLRAVTRGVESVLTELQPGLADIKVDTTIFNPATFVADDLERSLLLAFVGLVLAAGALYAYVRRLRGVLVLLWSIIVSFSVSIIALYMLGTSLNILVVAGLIASFGIVADILINGIHRGRTPEHAVALSVTLALIVLPLVFLDDSLGLLMRPFAIAFVASIVVGAAVAALVVPVLKGLFLKHMSLVSTSSPSVAAVTQRYITTLEKVARAPKMVYGIAAVLIVIGLVGVGFAKKDTLLTLHEHNLVVQIEHMPGVSHPKMVETVTNIDAALQGVEGVQGIGSHIGRSITGDQVVDIETALILLSLDTGVDHEALDTALAEIMSEYPEVAYTAKSYSQGVFDAFITKENEDLFVRLYGPEHDVLREQAEQLADAFAGVEGIEDISIDSLVLRPEIHITVDLEKARWFGLKPGDVRRAASTLVNGLLVGHFFDHQKVFEVVVWSTSETRTSIDDVRSLLIDLPRGGRVRLDTVADVELKQALNVIEREGISRYIDIAITIDSRAAGSVANDITHILNETMLPLEYHASVMGEYDRENNALLRMVLVISIVIVGILLVLQSIFSSWRLALMSLVTIPTALSGGVIAILVAGGGVISLGSLVGFLTVLGVATRNSIMLISHYQHLENEEGEPFGDNLIIRGARERITPILMTAFTTAFAIIPLVIAGNIPGHEIEHPMALVILGGLITATLLNLFVMPVLYRWVRGTKSQQETL